MANFDPQAYGPILGPLLDVDRRRPLDAGTPQTANRDVLQSLDVSSLSRDCEPQDRDMAALCLSGLWLLYDFLDDSHQLSQQVKTSSGSFWHGIMHRREGDFSNAKYWFRQTGSHPVLEQLSAEAEQYGFAAAAWDPFQFVDACQAAVERGDASQDCLALQQREWELLFDYCFRSALAT